MPSRSAVLNEVKDAVPSEVKDASLTLGRTKNGGSAGQKMGARQDKKWGLGRTKNGARQDKKWGLGKTKEGLIGKKIKRTLGRTM
jgi:hypothetical protein